MELFPHQRTMRDFHIATPNSLDQSEVGTGKTAGLATALQHYYDCGKIYKTLVIAPSSILDNWQRELSTWTTLSSVILRGDKKKRKELLKQIVNVYIINYEGINTIYEELLDYHWDMVICDEVHRIKSYRARQTKQVLALAKKAEYRKALSGTVLTNSLLDVWSIAQFVDPKIFRMNYWGFRNTFMFDENAGKPWLKFPALKPKPGAVEEIRAHLLPYSVRFEKREVLQHLPPVLFQQRRVELDGEQKRVYRQLVRDFVADLDSGEQLAALNILARVTKLLEVTSGFAYKDGSSYRFKENAKLTELKNILEELDDKQAIIWCAFKEDVKIVGESIDYRKHNVGMIIGDTPEKDRQPMVDAFNRGEYQYLICHPACAGEGLTILAPYAIYFSRGWKLGERLQSLGRFDRPGAEKHENLTVIDLIATDTMDEEVIKKLDGKEDLLRSITPDSFRTMVSK